MSGIRAIPARTYLTKAQKALVAAVIGGAVLRREFDVHSGYWWELDGEQVDIRPATALLIRGFISLGEVERRFSGRHTRLANLADATNKRAAHP